MRDARGTVLIKYTIFILYYSIFFKNNVLLRILSMLVEITPVLSCANTILEYRQKSIEILLYTVVDAALPQLSSKVWTL